MRKSGCNKRNLPERAKPRNGDISLFQRFLKMGVSTADCMWQIAESIPELLNPERSTIMRYRLLGKSGLRVSEASLVACRVGFGTADAPKGARVFPLDQPVMGLVIIATTNVYSA